MRFLPRPQPTVREEARSTHSVLLSVSLGRTRYFSSHLVGRVGLMRGKLGNVLGFMATCPGEPLLCEKAGSRQPSTLSDGDHVRPASATPRHRASFPLLSRLRDPNTGAFLHPNGEGAADPGRGRWYQDMMSIRQKEKLKGPQETLTEPAVVGRKGQVTRW